MKTTLLRHQTSPKRSTMPADPTYNNPLYLQHTTANLSWLKIAAILAMTWDHLAYGLLIHNPILLPWWTILRTPGRISIPIFALLIAWNYAHNTRHPAQYVARLTIFAFICEPIYILYFGYPGNAFVPLALGAAILHHWNPATKTTHKNAKHTALWILAAAIAISFHAPDIFAETATITLLGQYFIDNRKQWKALTAIALMPALNGQSWQFYATYALVLLAVWAAMATPITLPNVKLPKWLAYGFYPLHLLGLLALIGPA